MKAKNAMIELLNCDCMEYMKGCEDNAFDLAIVDPPYGIGFGQFNRTNTLPSGERIKADAYKQGDWDKIRPTSEYHAELERVSSNRIVWGGNYFPELWADGCKGFIFWWKHQPVDNFSDGELAWTSFNRPAKCFDFAYFGGIQGRTKADSKIHPTQKPVRLYDWLLANYAKEGDRILDTHLGSGSSAIAAHYGGFDFVGMEIDKDYYEAAVKRFNSETAQVDMFGGCDP